MIAQHALGTPCGDQVSNMANDPGTVRTPVAQVTDEDQVALVRVRTVRVGSPAG